MSEQQSLEANETQRKAAVAEQLGRGNGTEDSPDSH